jgi:hypothetical protein
MEIQDDSIRIIGSIEVKTVATLGVDRTAAI